MIDEFREAVRHAVNCHSMENGSDTPDFILAQFLVKCLSAFDVAVRHRADWASRTPAQPVEAQGDDLPPFKRYTIDGGLGFNAGTSFEEESEFGEWVRYEDARAAIAHAGQTREVTPDMLRAAQLRTEIGAFVCGNWTGAYDLLVKLYQTMYDASLKGDSQESK